MKPRDRECSTCRHYETAEAYCRLKDRYQRPTGGGKCGEHEIRIRKKKRKGQEHEMGSEIIQEMPLISSSNKVFY